METLFVISILGVLGTFIYVIYDAAKHFKNKHSHE
jgi:hypothetical protein